MRAAPGPGSGEALRVTEEGAGQHLFRSDIAPDKTGRAVDGVAHRTAASHAGGTGYVLDRRAPARRASTPTRGSPKNGAVVGGRNTAAGVQNRASDCSWARSTNATDISMADGAKVCGRPPARWGGECAASRERRIRRGCCGKPRTARARRLRCGRRELPQAPPPAPTCTRDGGRHERGAPCCCREKRQRHGAPPAGAWGAAQWAAPAPHSGRPRVSGHGGRGRVPVWRSAWMSAWMSASAQQGDGGVRAAGGAPQQRACSRRRFSLAFCSVAACARGALASGAPGCAVTECVGACRLSCVRLNSRSH